MRTVNARSLAQMMPTAMVPMKSAIPPTTTASTALQTISVKMVREIQPNHLITFNLPRMRW